MKPQLQFLNSIKSQLNSITKISSASDHIKCLNIVKIDVPEWEEMENGSDYFKFMESYFAKAETEIANMVQWHMVYRNAKSEPLYKGLSERFYISEEIASKAIAIDDPQALIDFTMAHIHPIGTLKMLPTRHPFRKWCSERQWPSNVSFQPFINNSGRIKIQTTDFIQ